MSSISSVGAGSYYVPAAKTAATRAAKPPATTDGSSATSSSGSGTSGVTYKSKGGDIIALSSNKVVVDKDHDGH